MSTRQTLKDYLTDRGIGGVNTISYNTTKTSGDSPELVDEGDDLSFDPNTGINLINNGSSAGIVPNYLGYITEREGNTYPIDGTTYTETPSPDRGTSLQTPETQGAVSVFKQSDQFPVVTSYFDGSGNPISTILDKVGNGAAPTGPDLIDSVKSAEVESDVVTGQSKAVTAPFDMLKKYNKYADAAGASDAKFVEATSDGGTDASSTLDDAIKLGFQRSEGDYNLGDTFTSRQVPMRDMHAVAHSMLLKAAGWDTSTTSFTSADPEKFFDDIQETNFAAYPTLVSALIPDQVRPRESYGAPTVGEASLLAGAGEAIPRDGADAKYSKASTSVYTPDVVFSPTTEDQFKRLNIGNYQAAISIVSLCELIQQTINDFSSYTKDEGNLETFGLGPFYMGHTTQTKTTASLRAISNIALINTGRFAFDECVRAGVTLYFGVDLSTLKASGENTSAEAALASGANAGIQSRMAQSYGFWQSVTRSCVKLISNVENALLDSNSALFADTIIMLLRSKALRVVNVFAQIGYTYLIAHLTSPTPDSQLGDPESGSRKLDTPFSIDTFASLPGSRVMKSRDKYDRSALALAWRHGSIPSALLLPPALIQASLDLDYVLEGPNAVKQLASTTLQSKTYVSARQFGRIPIEVVNNLENRLDAEYVPFYFHDLRTNEVIGLHAFLDSLTDNYSVNFTPTQAYGRADPVKNYNNTKRSIGFSFWLVSTSEDDFDEMWAKINKIVTLAYPQYTQGTLVTVPQRKFNAIGGGVDFRFEQPFSQIVGASPLIRLRIGDVIKSNYSRFNLGRLFGAGNTGTGAISTSNKAAPNSPAGKYEDKLASKNDSRREKNFFANALLMPLLGVIGSPAELLTFSNLQTGAASFGKALAFDALDLLLKNGFVNPLLQALMTFNSVYPSGNDNEFLNSLTANGKIFLKPRAEPYVFERDNKKTYVKVTRPMQIRVEGLPNSPANRITESGAPIEVQVSLSRSFLDFPVNETFVYPPDLSPLENGAKCKVTLDQCLFDPDGYFSLTLAGLMFFGQLSGGDALGAIGGQLATSAANTGAAAVGIPMSSLSLISDFIGSYMRQFTAPTNNPITFAMEDSMSRGLAGVLTSINFTWIDPSTSWDVRWNSRAPMACKITMGFDPIHDISPGLDAYGANRAPLYNVGSMRLIAGDQHRDNGLKSREFFERLGAEPQLFREFKDWTSQNETIQTVVNFATK